MHACEPRNLRRAVRRRVSRTAAFVSWLLSLTISFALATGLAASGCGSQTERRGPSTGPRLLAPPSGEDMPLGHVTRNDIEMRDLAWAAARTAATPAVDPSRALATVRPGAEIVVVLGTWCGDSRREVPRFFRALELAEAALPQGGALPFTVTLISVDRAKQAPGGLVDGLDVRYVPTFIVRREGREVGRIVESVPAPGNVESTLLAMLRGEQSGVVSGRAGL